MDETPTRAPLVAADLLIPAVKHKTFVEIGTRNGDLFSCASRFASRASVIEKDPAYCEVLRRRGIEVTCTELNNSTVREELPDADVYFMWMLHKYSLGLVQLVDAELKRRGRSATFIYLLTATFLPELSALPSHLAALDEAYHESTTLTRLFFQEPCVNASLACAYEPPRFWQTAKGPNAHWGVMHAMSVAVGHTPTSKQPTSHQSTLPQPLLPRKKLARLARRKHLNERLKELMRGSGSGPGGDATFARCQSHTKTALPAQRIAARTIGQSRCFAPTAGQPRFTEPRSAYPHRSPLVAADAILDVLRAGNVGGGTRLKILSEPGDDLSRCMSKIAPSLKTAAVTSFEEDGGGRIGRIKGAEAASPREETLAWYWRWREHRDAEFELASRFELTPRGPLKGRSQQHSSQQHSSGSGLELSSRLVTHLSAAMRAGRYRRAVAFIGIDGYSLGEGMKMLPTLLRRVHSILRVKCQTLTSTLQGLPFDESDVTPLEDAHLGVTANASTSTSSNIMAPYLGGGGRDGLRRRFGVWQLLRLEMERGKACT